MLFKSLLVLAPLAAAAPANFARQASASSAASASKTAASGSAPTVTETASGGNSTAMTASTPSSSMSMKGTSGFSDLDILNFALFAEHLESTFYSQGFSKFQASDFMAAGADMSSVQEIMDVQKTEAIHVTTLQGAITAAGGTPVQACDYNFDAALASADAMLKTARVLESVGIGAYLGAAPLINSSAVLSAAASIVTVESRHQTVLRKANNATLVPAAFDTALSPRQVATLATPFVKSCPSGSALPVMPFPAIALENASQATLGSSLKLQDPAQPSGASFCAFLAPTGAQYTPIANGQCNVPQNMSGEVFMMITSAMATTDDKVLAGPAVITVS